MPSIDQRIVALAKKLKAVISLQYVPTSKDSGTWLVLATPEFGTGSGGTYIVNRSPTGRHLRSTPEAALRAAESPDDSDDMVDAPPRTQPVRQVRQAQPEPKKHRRLFS